MSEPCPIKDISNEDDAFDNLALARSCFIDRYDREPTFYVRVPGRVNLIGEHIDYCGYAVLPMAIEQDIVLAVGINTKKQLNLTNFNAQGYGESRTSIDTLKIDVSDGPKWQYYFWCGVRGVLEHHKPSVLVGMDVAVHGTVPPSAGLSSSSALVCAAALASLHAHKLSMSKTDLASLCARSERFIGTEGGGMDQAIAILAEIGSAKLIEFNPLRTHNVTLPDGATFVVANSCVQANKAATAHYNIRVVECRLAAKVIAEKNGLDWKSVHLLGEVQNLLKISPQEMVPLVEEALHPQPYNREELCTFFQISQEEFGKDLLSANTLDLQEFKLQQRALHVFGEAGRVLQFQALCARGSNCSLAELGHLMSQSHASCRDLYQCSHSDLDVLVDISLRAGALGSRLTGAGWGGCSVSLVPSDRVDDFLSQVKSEYYGQNPRRKQVVSASIFPTKPGGGAVIYKVV